jgi:hypothetical protein
MWNARPELKDDRNPDFRSRLQRLIGQVEAWSYADSDAGAGLAEEIASGLRRLAADAPSTALARSIQRAQDALDDGLTAEALAAALYEVRRRLESGASQDSGRSSPSG